MAYRYIYDDYVSEGVGCFLSITEKWTIREKNESDIEPDYIFVVWKQDQLQEKLDKWTLLGKIRGLLDFCEPEFMCPDEPPCKECEELGLYARKNFNSIEQLWLGFLMKEKYQKIWSKHDKNWITPKKPFTLDEEYFKDQDV